MPPRTRPAADSREWLRRARSNLARAKDDSGIPEVLYEDLCFDCQQAAEKALKAVLVHRGIDFPRVHSISHLIELLELGKVRVPSSVKEAAALTHFAVESRYPGVSEVVTRDEYLEALDLSGRVYQWASLHIGRLSRNRSGNKTTTTRP